MKVSRTSLSLIALLICVSAHSAASAQARSDDALPEHTSRSGYSPVAVRSDVPLLLPPRGRVSLYPTNSYSLLILGSVEQKKRRWWQFPLIGAGIGAVVGGLYGYRIDSTAEDLLAFPPNTLFYAGVGVLTGALAGVVANSLTKP